MFTILILLLSVSAQIWAGPNTLSDEQMHPRFTPLPISSVKADPVEEATSSYWRGNAQKTVLDITSRAVNRNVAKNVIMFLGDGMSIPTIAATRVYAGGEEVELSFDKFPQTAFSKTYAVDSQVADSANTATAYLGGVKANYGTIGVGPEVMRYDCLGTTNTTNHVLSIAYHSQQKNKRTGLVTTARVTHASPAGVYAHTAARDWESDSDMIRNGEDPSMCPDIATQLLYGETGKNLNVVMGGGRNKLLPNDVTDEEGHKGDRSDGANLIETWLGQRENAQYVWNRDQLLGLMDVDNVIGLFAHDHIDYNLDRDTTMDPSLAEMTQVAIETLSRGEDGFFLFVEGARIDMAHHETASRIALDETVEFSKAIQTAVDLTDEADTLIVVTADHAHTMSYSGYAPRGGSILGFGGRGSDDLVYTVLNYANGPGYKRTDSASRYDLSTDDMTITNYKYPAVAPMGSETHGGDDVAIFARGPWAHIFAGTLEQNTLPHLMAYASCVGEGHTACDGTR